MVTLENIINNNHLKNLNCVSGNGFLNNIVESVNIVDNPDTARWLKKHEFLLSTGYLFTKMPQEERSKFLIELKHNECSGIGIKVKRFLSKVPDDMIETSERIGFPIIEIPYFYSLSDIITVIYNCIFEQEHIIDKKSLLIENAALDFSADCGIVKMLSNMQKYVHCSFVITLSSEAFTTIIASAVLPEHKSYFTKLKNGPYINTNRVNVYNRENAEDMFFIDTPLRYSEFEIPNTSARLFITTGENEANEDIKELVKSVLPIMSVEITKHFQLSNNFTSFHGMLFIMLTAVPAYNEPDTVRICNYYGINPFLPRVCISVVVNNAASFITEDIILQISSAIKNITDNKAKIITANNKNMVSVFLVYEDDVSNAAANSDAYVFAGHIINYLEKNSKNVLIGISACQRGPDTMQSSYRQSLYSIYLGKSAGHINVFMDNVEKYLLSSLERYDLNTICENILEPVLRLEKSDCEEIILTVKALHDTRFNIAETARRLYIHRNTLTNRMDKIKLLLGENIFEPDNFDSLMLGIKALEVLN